MEGLFTSNSHFYGPTTFNLKGRGIIGSANSKYICSRNLYEVHLDSFTPRGSEITHYHSHPQTLTAYPPLCHRSCCIQELARNLTVPDEESSCSKHKNIFEKDTVAEMTCRVGVGGVFIYG